MLPADVASLLSGAPIADIRSIEPIKHGLTNDSWLVRTSADAFVIRRSNASEASLQIDRESEALVLETVARAGLGAQIVSNDRARHVLITRYAGTTWTPQQALEPANIDRVALLLRRLHGLSVPPAIRKVDLLSVAEGYLETLDVHGTAFPSLSALRGRAREVADLLEQQAVPCLCHNDVHALNIVDDGTLRLIDWEYAGLGERLFDLASICVYHDYDRPRREQLLATYAGSCDPQTWHRLELCCWLFDYIRELWTAVRNLQPA